MANIQATYTVEGVTFTEKREAKAYSTVCEQIDIFCDSTVNCNDIEALKIDMRSAYLAGVFKEPARGRGPSKKD